MQTAHIGQVEASRQRFAALLSEWRAANTPQDRDNAKDAMTMVLANLVNYGREDAIGIAEALLYDFAVMNGYAD